MAIESSHNLSTGGTVFVDSMSYIRRLEAKGYTQEQAEEQISVMLDIMNNNLASKQDLIKLESDLKSEMKQMELRMVVKLGGIMLAGIAIMKYFGGSI